jgi:excisionase family DNA binding protein
VIADDPVRVLVSGVSASLRDDAAVLRLETGELAEAAGYDCVVAGPAELRHVRETAPETALVAVVSDPDEAREAVRAGAHACVPADNVTPGRLRLAVAEALERRGGRAPAGPAGPDVMTLQQAAATLGVTQSRLRRWSDEGRIAAVRTAGGHRRFPLDAVRRLARELGPAPAVRPLEPPSEPLPTLAARLAADGAELVRAAAASLYRTGQPGWFAAPAAAPPAAEWVAELQAACASGRYARAGRATDALMRRAQRQGASLLERHAFLERFSMISQRALVLSGAPRGEQGLARRLFAAFEQRLLDQLD